MDALENFDKLPQEIQNILNSVDGNEDYLSCLKIVKRLNEIGWDADFGLSAEITDVWEINNPANKLTTIPIPFDDSSKFLPTECYLEKNGLPITVRRKKL